MKRNKWVGEQRFIRRKRVIQNQLIGNTQHVQSSFRNGEFCLNFFKLWGLEKAFPILEEQVYDMKLKKGKHKIGELKLRCKRGEPNLEKERVNSITS